MLILDRYLLRNFLKGFFAALFAFIFFYIIIDIISTLRDITTHHPPVIKIIELYIYSIPIMLGQTAPIAALMSTLFTLGALNQNNELIAMRSSGLSIYHIVKPIIVFGFLLSLAIFLINETIAPQAQKMAHIIKEYYIQKPPDATIEQPLENVALYGFNNRLFFLNKLYPKTNTIEGLTILEHDERQDVKAKIYAEKAVWRNNRWVLYQCYIYRFTDTQRIKGEPLYFNNTKFKIDETPQDFLRQSIPIEDMNIRELSRYISRLSESGARSTLSKFKVDLYQKTSMPFTSLIIILLGIPSSVVIRRKAVAFSSIGLCIGITFIFYIIFAVSIALGKSGVLPPLLCAWMTHIVFASSALYFIARIP